jgi:CubicO group peptidase (beta-lactamase class C family)
MEAFWRTALIPAIGTFLFVLGSAHFGQAGAQASTNPLQASSIETQVQQMVQVINDGDDVAQRNFASTHFSERFLRDTPVDRLVDHFRKMKTQSGGIDVSRVLKPEMPGQANMLLQTRTGHHFVRVVAFEDSGKIGDYFLLTATDPEGDISDDWPTAKVSPAEVRRQIERHAEFAAVRDLFSGVVLVADENEVLFHKAYGIGERSFDSPNRLDTKFNLASMDKMFTGVAIGQLVAAGKLSFDNKLSTVLPDYPNAALASKITIDQLLTHTSGLGDALKPEMREKKKNYQAPRDFFPLFVNDPPWFEPGSGWGYSNAGYIVLGAVIEKISGQSYFDYVRDHIFLTTGMRDTGYFELDQVVPNLAVGYGRFEDDILGVGSRRSNVVFLGYRGNSAGGGYSTAPDLLRFARALRKHRLLSPEMTEKVTAGKVAAGDDRYGYGFWQWQTNQRDVRGNSGGGPNSGIDSNFRMFWDGSYTVIVLSNYDPPGGTNLARNITGFLARQ